MAENGELASKAPRFFKKLIWWTRSQ